MMKFKSLIILYFVRLIFIISGFNNSTKKETALTIAVSILPEASYVKAITGDLANVVTLIPPGASPTNYQPTPKEMIQLEQADVYFTIGVSAESTNILPNINLKNKSLLVVELANEVEKKYPSRYFENHSDDDAEHSGRDPHIWMSPKRVMIMISSIRDTLIELDPKNANTYKDNTEKYLRQLKNLDEYLNEQLSTLSSRKFIVMHPSLGYFADDYHLTMIAIEKDGKEATITHLQNIIDTCLNENISVVLYQEEFDHTQATTIANEIHGNVYPFEPLASSYIENMTLLGDLFSDLLE